MAAQEQFTAVANRRGDALNDPNAERAREAYLEVLNLGEELGDHRADTPLEKVQWSEMYAEIAAFVVNRGDGIGVGVPPEALLQKALLLNPTNTNAIYLTTRFLPEKSEDDYRRIEARLKTVLQIAPRFTEAWSALTLLQLRHAHFKEADVSRQRMLATLSYFHPELHWFDDSYPPPLVHMEVNGRTVERRPRNKDPRRFFAVENVRLADGGLTK